MTSGVMHRADRRTPGRSEAAGRWKGERMNKFVLILLATSVALGATTLHLVHELRAERDGARRLEARVAELERATAASAFSSAPEPLPAQATESSSAPPAPAATLPQPASIATVSAISSPADQPSRAERIRMMEESVARQRAL